MEEAGRQTQAASAVPIPGASDELRPAPPPLVGQPWDGLWLWLPLPILGALAWGVGLMGDLPRHAALQLLLLLNFLHLGATWTRLYGDARREHPFAAYVLPALLFAFCGLLMWTQREGLLFLVVFLVNIPHIGLQNYGLIQVAARRAGASTALDRGLDKAYQLAIPMALALWFASRAGADLFDSVAIGLDRLPAPILASLMAVAAALGIAVFARMLLAARDGQPVPAERWALHAAYGPGMALCFLLLPPELAPIPVAGTHYIQYLVVVRRFHTRAGALTGRPGLWARIHPLAYLMLLGLLAPGIPVVVDTALAPLLGGLLPAIGAAASLHHFIADGLLWRMREPRVGRLMLA